MHSRFFGSALQVLGVLLIGLGIATFATTQVLHSTYPAVPFLVFGVCGGLLALPPIFVGIYLYTCGSSWRGTATAEIERTRYEFSQMRVWVCFAWLLGWGAAAPVFVRAAGIADLGPTFLLVWAVGWVLVFGAGGLWAAKSLWPRIERRLAKRRGTYDLKPPRL